MPIFEGSAWVYKKGSLPRFSCALAFISTGYKFFLILYERGMADKDVRRRGRSCPKSEKGYSNKLPMSHLKNSSMGTPPEPTTKDCLGWN